MKKAAFQGERPLFSKSGIENSNVLTADAMGQDPNIYFHYKHLSLAWF